MLYIGTVMSMPYTYIRTYEFSATRVSHLIEPAISYKYYLALSCTKQKLLATLLPIKNSFNKYI